MSKEKQLHLFIKVPKLFLSESKILIYYYFIMLE